MMNESGPAGHEIGYDSLPAAFPTHHHSPEFWEALGRAVATFGFLEEILARAVFALTSRSRIGPSEADIAYRRWLAKLASASSDPLAGRIKAYAKEARGMSALSHEELESLKELLCKAAEIRNVLCHGSWQTPDIDGRSLPRFVNKRMESFETSLDVAYLKHVQVHVTQLACEVINSVTLTGLQFPGSNGPGEPVLRPTRD